MGEIAEVQLNNYEETACKCGKKKAMPCCNHQYELVKVNDVHQQVAADFSFKAPEITLHAVDNLFSLLTLKQVPHTVVGVHAPPLLIPPDICIQNCVFRI